MTAAVLIPLVLIVGAASWVYADSKANREVTASIGSSQIDTPQTWAACCVAVLVLGFPLYLIARKTAN